MNDKINKKTATNIFILVKYGAINFQYQFKPYIDLYLRL